MNFSLDKPAAVLLLLALSNAVLHALIPSHWLAFALVGRAHRWTIRQTLTVTALAGTGHILFTVCLGLLLARLGKEAQRLIPPALEHMAAAVVLILLGGYFLFRASRSGGGCQHPGHRHEMEPGEDIHSRQFTRIAAAPTTMGALALGITLSPCLELLSLYVAASSFPWHIIAALSLILAAVTLSLMLFLVWLTVKGLERLKLNWLERNEGYVMGGLLTALGIFLLFLR